MGSHDSFEFLKHKLWPKERPGIKLAIWLLITKIALIPLREGGMPHTIGKILTRATTFLKLDFDQRSKEEIIGLQSRRSPNFGDFETSTWESQDKMTLGVGPMAKHRVYYKGEGGGCPQIWAVMNLVSLCLLVVCPCTKNALTMH
jgi:hypothetical protein